MAIVRLSVPDLSQEWKGVASSNLASRKPMTLVTFDSIQGWKGQSNKVTKLVSQQVVPPGE